jgi:hypothetical protein
MVNKQNVRFWASENPRVILKKVHHAPRITVWVAISSHGLLVPVFFDETVNSERYLSMMRNTLCLTFLLKFVVTNLAVHARWSQAAHSECCFEFSA